MERAWALEADRALHVTPPLTTWPQAGGLHLVYKMSALPAAGGLVRNDWWEALSCGTPRAWFISLLPMASPHGLQLDTACLSSFSQNASPAPALHFSYSWAVSATSTSFEDPFRTRDVLIIPFQLCIPSTQKWIHHHWPWPWEAELRCSGRDTAQGPGPSSALPSPKTPDSSPF